jgi:hypothetical protein
LGNSSVDCARNAAIGEPLFHRLTRADPASEARRSPPPRAGAATATSSTATSSEQAARAARSPSDRERRRPLPRRGDRVSGGGRASRLGHVPLAFRPQRLATARSSVSPRAPELGRCAAASAPRELVDAAGCRVRSRHASRGAGAPAAAAREPVSTSSW